MEAEQAGDHAVPSLLGTTSGPMPSISRAVHLLSRPALGWFLVNPVPVHRVPPGAGWKSDRLPCQCLSCSSACVTAFPLGPLESPHRVWEEHSSNAFLTRGPAFRTLELRGSVVSPSKPLFFCILIFQGISGLVQQFSSPRLCFDIPSSLQALTNGRHLLAYWGRFLLGS